MDQEQAQQITDEVNAEQAQQQPSITENTPAQVSAETSQRPTGLPEKFKDVDGLINAYTNLEKQFGSTRKVEAPESYDINLSKDYEGKWSISDDDPLMSSFKTYAKDNNLSQQQFDSVVNFHVKNSLESNASLSKKFDDERASVLRELGYNSTPEFAEKEIKGWLMNKTGNVAEKDVDYLMQDSTALKVISMIKSNSGHHVPAPIAQKQETTIDSLRKMRAQPGFEQSGNLQKEYYRKLTESVVGKM